MTSDAPLGKLFVSLEPTQEEVRHICGSRAVYQQLIVLNIIKEFGFDIEVIVQVPPPLPGLRLIGASICSQE
jgi:hypothetical protein